MSMGIENGRVLGTESVRVGKSSTISAFGGRSDAVVEVDHLQRGSGPPEWSTFRANPRLLSQRAKSSPLWSRLFPGIRIGRGLARIARLLWGKAPCGSGFACPPPARPGAAPHERGDGGVSDPPVLSAGAAPGRGKWSTEWSTTPSPFFGGSLTPP